MKFIYYILIIFTLLLLISVNVIMGSVSKNDNLLNKVNAVENQWIDYNGLADLENNMVKSQFIPYSPEGNYEVTHDTYISYFNGEDFIQTILYENTPVVIDTVEQADGIILSFNKENKNGIKLIKED